MKLMSEKLIKRKKVVKHLKFTGMIECQVPAQFKHFLDGIYLKEKLSNEQQVWIQDC